jgi:uncharacterized membrane protein
VHDPPAAVATFASFAMAAVVLVLRRYREPLAVNLIALALVFGPALILVRIYRAQAALVAVLCPQCFIAAGQALALRRVLWRRPAPALARA